MAADFSRVRYNPLLDYAAWSSSRARVLLDADANELVGDSRSPAARAGRRRARPRHGRGEHARRVPHHLGRRRLSLIGRGRLYVDGLLAENHGAADPAQREFDASDGRAALHGRYAYAPQPYLPNPPALPAAGRHLVYLDVWDREVTHLEHPDLVETAVGVETSSRAADRVAGARARRGGRGATRPAAHPTPSVPGWARC